MNKIQKQTVVISRYHRPCLTRQVLAFAVFATTFVIAAIQANHNLFAQAKPGEPETIRELFVPFPNLDALLGKDTNRVFMPRKDYEALKQSARILPATQLPHQAALLAADYQGTIREGRLLIRGDLTIDVLSDSLQPLSLDFAELGIRTATLDGQPARLAKDAKGSTILFIAGAGTHHLILEMLAPVTVDAAQQSFAFQVPTPPACEFRLSVPGNVEIKSGASVVNRSVDQSTLMTTFQLVPKSGRNNVTMSLNNRKTREQNTIMARGVVVAEITQAYERFHASMAMNVVNGATNEFRFNLSDDLDVSSVACEGLNRWETADIDGNQQLVVYLRSPVTAPVVVNVRMERGTPELSDWRFPEFSPTDVASYSAVIGLVTEDRLRVNSLTEQSLFTIDSSVLIDATSESMFIAEPGAPRVNAIAAYYATHSDFSLRATFEFPEPSFDINANSLFQFSDAGVTVSGGLTVSPENQNLFSLEFLPPTNWDLKWVREDGDRDLPFDRFQQADGTRIRVQMPRGVSSGDTKTIWFNAQYTPPDWLGIWQTQSVTLPSFNVFSANSHQGVIAIDVRDDLSARPSETAELVLISESEKAVHNLDQFPSAIAYRYDSPGWSATVDLQRLAARQTARVLTFARVESESIRIHGELVYLIADARSSTLSFSLPETTPTEIAIAALDNVQVKETSSELVDSRRLWTVELSKRQSGRVRLSVDFLQPLESEEPKGVTLPILRSERVDYQTGAIALEGHSELETQVKSSPRSIDIGELADANYQVGKRLIGVYGYVADNDTLIIDITRRPIHALPSTIVQRAEVFSILSAQGRVQSAARYTLRTKATIIESVLPDNAVLWAVMVDGKPALPQRIDDRVMIAIPADANALTRDLRIVYETSISPLGFSNDVKVGSPRLFQRGNNGNQGSEIPIADQKWRLGVPSGYQMTRANGRLVQHARENRNGLWSNLEWLGGGHQNFWTPMSFDRVAATAAERHQFLADADYGSENAPSSNITSPTEEHIEYDMAYESMMDSEGMGMAMSGPEPTNQSSPAMGIGRNVQSDTTASPVVAEPDTASQIASGKATMSDQANKQPSWQLWALEGVRSLPINLSKSLAEESIELTGLGGSQATQITVVNSHQLRWLAWTLAALVFAAGLTIRKPANRFNYLFIAILTSVLLPTAFGLTNELGGVQAAILAACVALLVYYLVKPLCHLVKSNLLVKTDPKAKTALPLIAVALLGLSISSPATAQSPTDDPFSGPAKNVSSPADLTALIESLRNGLQQGPVAIPENAVVIPYTPATERSMPSERVLVPFKVYQRLLKIAESLDSPSLTKLPNSHAWSDVSYTTTLDSSGQLRMIGTMTLEQFDNGPMLVPLTLSGCVIESATLDNQPAKLRLINPVPNLQQTSLPSAPVEMLALYTHDRGTKQFKIVLRMQLQKSGGWRIANGRVPSAAACSLLVKIANPATEVRLNGMADRTNLTTARADEVFETAFPVDGKFSIRWRDQISEATIDRGLTADSKTIFDIREDSVRLAWQADFQFRRGRRESLTMSFPDGYLVEKVLGNNIRGWTVSPKDSKNLLDVELLKPAVDRESVTVILSKQHSFHSDQQQSFSVPNVTVPDAMLQQGRITIRKSELLDIHVPTTSGLTRIDIPDETQWFSELNEPGPIPISTFQSYRYSQNRFELPVQVSVTAPTTTAQIQSLVKISERNTQIESRLLLNTKGRPIYRIRVKLPPNLEVQTPKVPGDFQWSISKQNDSRVLVIQMADGQLGQYSILINGELPAVAKDVDSNTPATLPIPKLELLDIEKQSGALVVQPDPAFDVRATDLKNCNVVLRNTVLSWLTPQQRQLARSVVAFRDASYAGNIEISARTAYVSSLSVTNVKVTDRAVEETIYIEATITSAGIKEYSFLLPAHLASAKIEAPLVRQKTILPIDETLVRVTLELQDSILGRYAVIIQNDRLLGSGLQSAPIPTLETGKTFSRVLTLENASRDELLTQEMTAIEPVDRTELTKHSSLKRLSGKSSLVYRVKENATLNTPPNLTYRTKTRATLSTTGARIGLAQTLLIVDHLGTYRGKQEYRVENRTEPYLEISLPENARLWTVEVADQTIKPTASGSGSIRIPLIKTAEGDLDYGVVLKYGGRLSRPGKFNKIQFPLIKTININVELSQVRLRLPEDFRWFSFDSTMKRVLSDADLQAGWLSFRTKQISELTSLLSSRGGQYSKMRAKFNLKQLEQSVQQQSQSYSNSATYSDSEELQKKLQDSTVALEQAQVEIQEFEDVNLDDNADFDNRGALGQIYQSQSNTRSRNVASALGNNFLLPEGESAKKSESSTEVEESTRRFDQSWLRGNQLAIDSNNKNESSKTRFGKRDEPDKQPSAAKELKSKGLQTRLPERVQSRNSRISQSVDKAAQQQIAGDYRAQAKRYSERLQKGQGVVAGLAPISSDQQGNNHSGFSQNAPTTNLFGDSLSMSAGMGGFGGGLGRDEVEKLDAEVPEQSESGVSDRSKPAQLGAAEGFLASLEVDFPVRGKEYFFTTPGGDLELSARSLDSNLETRASSTAWVLAVASLILLIRKIASNWMTGRPTASAVRTATAVIIGIAGFASLVSGTLPIFGFVAILISLVLLFSLRSTRSQTSSHLV